MLLTEFKKRGVPLIEKDAPFPQKELPFFLRGASLFDNAFAYHSRIKTHRADSKKNQPCVSQISYYIVLISIITHNATRVSLRSVNNHYLVRSYRTSSYSANIIIVAITQVKRVT